MHWLERAFRRFSQIFWSGTLQPTRSAVNFTGAAVTVTDNAALDRLDVAIDVPNVAALDNATPAPTPNTVVLRSGTGAASFAGESSFEAISVGELVVNEPAEFNGTVAFNDQIEGEVELVDGIMGVGPGLTVSSAAGAPLIVGSSPAPGATSGLLQLVTGNAATSGDILIVPGTGTTARGNIALGTSVASWQAMQGGVFVGNRAAAPTGNPSGGVFLYAESGALKARGSSGTVTTVAPAEPHCPRCGRDFALEWENHANEEALAVCLACLLDALEAAGVPRDRFIIREKRARRFALQPVG